MSTQQLGRSVPTQHIADCQLGCKMSAHWQIVRSMEWLLTTHLALGWAKLSVAEQPSGGELHWANERCAKMSVASVRVILWAGRQSRCQKHAERVWDARSASTRSEYACDCETAFQHWSRSVYNPLVCRRDSFSGCPSPAVQMSVYQSLTWPQPQTSCIHHSPLSPTLTR